MDLALIPHNQKQKLRKYLLWQEWFQTLHQHPTLISKLAIISKETPVHTLMFYQIYLLLPHALKALSYFNDYGRQNWSTASTAALERRIRSKCGVPGVGPPDVFLHGPDCLAFTTRASWKHSHKDGRSSVSQSTLPLFAHRYQKIPRLGIFWKDIVWLRSDFVSLNLKQS